MAIKIDETNLKHGVLGLALALIEVIRDALKTQALKRMEGRSLSDLECEKLGQALMELDTAIEEIKEEQGLTESVQAVRNGLDDIVDSLINKLDDPNRRQEAGVRG